MEAVISDIHGNLEALNAVLADLRRKGIERIICLGDIVGYGPNPRECVDIARRFSLSVLGNHDEATLFAEQAECFNEKAVESINWTRKQLDSGRDALKNDGRWSFLGELQAGHSENGVLYVHGSPRSPVKEYVFPDIVLSPTTLADIFSKVTCVAFNGHTHIPGVIVEGSREYLHPEDIKSHYELNGIRVIVNVGSVGQPRDGNAKACYVMFDGRRIEFVRVEYDFRQTIAKMKKVGLDDELADRLAVGR